MLEKVGAGRLLLRSISRAGKSRRKIVWASFGVSGRACAQTSPVVLSMCLNNRKGNCVGIPHG